MSYCKPGGGEHSFEFKANRLYVCERCGYEFTAPLLPYGLLYGRLRDIDKNHDSSYDDTLLWLIDNGYVERRETEHGITRYYLTESGEDLLVLAFDSLPIA